jgi:D-alanine transaminase
VAAPFPIAWLNGEFVSLADARVSPLDRGFLFADGVYEVVPVHRGRPFRLRQHLARLDRSLDAIRIARPLPDEQWDIVLSELATRAGAAEQLLYVQVTRGMEFGRNHLFPLDGTPPTLFAFAGPYSSPPAEALEKGLAAVTLQDIRWERCDIKSIALLPNVLLRQQAQDQGASEALLVRDGQLLEGSSSTVFVVTRGLIATPPNSHHILPGTSRDAIVDLAQDWRPIESRPIAAAELETCDEVWIASAGRGVLPVTRIDGRPVGDGKPGRAWSAMYARLQHHLDGIAGTPALAP